MILSGIALQLVPSGGQHQGEDAEGILCPFLEDGHGECNGLA